MWGEGAVFWLKPTVKVGLPMVREKKGKRRTTTQQTGEEEKIKKSMIHLNEKGGPIKNRQKG